MKYAITLIACGLAFGQSERECVLTALEKSPGIKIERITHLQDSLSFLGAKTEAGLQLTLSGNNLVEWHPNLAENSLSTKLEAKASSLVPGGGNLALALSENSLKDNNAGNAPFTTRSELSFTQPLLKNGWGYGETDYRIRQERNTLRISAEQFRKNLLAALTEVRLAYWQWVLYTRALNIRTTELEYAGNAMAFERARFSLGQGSELDTLSAALELVQAAENLVSAEYSEKNSRRQLSLFLGFPPDTSLGPPRDSLVTLSPVPTSDQLLEASRKNSPDLNILAVTRESFVLEAGKTGNALLPTVDFKAAIAQTRNGDAPFADNIATAFPSAKNDPYVGVQFTWDLLSRKERLERRKALLSVESGEIQETQALEKLKSDVADFTEAWKRDSLGLALQEKKAEIAEKRYKYSLESYKLGAINQLEMSKAKNDYISAALDRLTAEVNLKKLEIAVDRSTGAVMDKFSIRF